MSQPALWARQSDQLLLRVLQVLQPFFGLGELLW